MPFAREYGGTLDNRSFGGVQVSRTFYARGQTGQQLLLGAYSALSRQISKGSVQMYNRHEMLDVVMIDGVARGIIARNLLTGSLCSFYDVFQPVVQTSKFATTPDPTDRKFKQLVRIHQPCAVLVALYYSVVILDSLH